jgi:hypothetical protein
MSACSAPNLEYFGKFIEVSPIPALREIPTGATVQEGQGSLEAQTRPLWQFVWAISRRICGGHDCASRSRSIVAACRGGRGMSFNICRGTLGSLAMFRRDKECLVARQPLHRHLPLRLILE